MPYDKSALFDFLEVLNEDLPKKITLVAAGGTAMTLLDLKTSTIEIDFTIPSCDRLEFEQALKNNPPGYKVDRLEAKALAIIIAFAALTIVLSAVKIPTIFWPQQNFRLWEIPIVTAFLLFGFRVGFPAAVIGIAGQTALFVGPAGILEAPWGIIVVLTMFLGLYLAKKLCKSRLAYMKGISGIMPIVFFTAFCIIVRTSIMLPVDYAIYSSILPIVIGVNIPNAYIIGLMPFTILFNVLVPLYTVPVSYLLAKTISNNVKTVNILQ